MAMAPSRRRAPRPGPSSDWWISFISPTVEGPTRTVKVRLEVDNTRGDLKPEMFADVFLNVDLGVGLVVPDGAVINAGDRRLVFLDRGEGRFEPREVKLGAKIEGSGVQVVSGVVEGDRSRMRSRRLRLRSRPK